MTGKTVLPDEAARVAALTTLDRSLLVEAGAGSGKTSIMAGRVALLLANGAEPKNVAAITFTEFAASELMIRIGRFVGMLAEGNVHTDIASVFPHGVSAKQQANLQGARKALDQLGCTTIHGFAQALIKPYPVEAGIDPGAAIIDPAEADLAFTEQFEAWLKQRLARECDDDIIAELVLANENGALDLIRTVADFRRSNRDALTAAANWSGSIAGNQIRAADAFSSELANVGFSEADTAAKAAFFADLVQSDFIPSLSTDRPPCRALIEASQTPRPEICFTQTGGKRKMQNKGKWETAAAMAGLPKAAGKQANDAALARYDACHDAFDALTRIAAGELLDRLFSAMDGLMADWRTYKRGSALLDFDDLLYTARDLLAGHDVVRQALARRFRHVLVDEFQDTDPVQLDILWRLCGEAAEARDPDPLARPLRPGELFLVGDPKQAIYRFRGADVNAYLAARASIGDDALLKITANFRSAEPILTFVNRSFETPLSAAAGQPGFTELSAICPAQPGLLAVVALDVDDGLQANAQGLRDAEADRVADLCSRLVGNRSVRDQDGALRPCRLGDIALLAPVGTDLWRFEEALESRGVPVSTQAGKGFFRRQEIQDLIALTRALADSRDTLALGALLRGPLVGLTEVELLDIAEGLPVDQNHPDRMPQLTLWADAYSIRNDLAREVIRSLQSVAKCARSTTPYALLCEAVTALNVRAQLRQRFRAGAERALANADVFLEMARSYDVRGLRAFAADMRSNWKDAVRQVEGRPDAEEHSVALITVHASKGLEWPIVIPINMTGAPRAESGLMHDRRSGRFSVPILGACPTDYDQIRSENAEELARERVRLWYVAATRARDLLVLPRHSSDLPTKAWARIVDFDLGSLPAIDPEALGDAMQVAADPPENAQTRTLFAAEAERIILAHHSIEWCHPSRSEFDESSDNGVEPIFVDPESAEQAFEPIMPAIAGGATRGTILHKLMEEVLNGETGDDAQTLVQRAAVLLNQLSIEPSENPAEGISPHELAKTIVRTLNVPEIKNLRPRLVAEHTIYGSHKDGNVEVIVSGIADALAYDENGLVDIIVDWKSDIEIEQNRLQNYRGQLGAYRRETGAQKALLVFMTAGKAVEV